MGGVYALTRANLLLSARGAPPAPARRTGRVRVRYRRTLEGMRKLLSWFPSLLGVLPTRRCAVSPHNHDHRLSRWFAPPYKGVVLAGLTPFEFSDTCKPALPPQMRQSNFSLPCVKGGGTACRGGGIVIFDFRDNNPSVTFSDSSLCTREPSAAAGLFNGKSLFRTTSLAGGFRYTKKSPVHVQMCTGELLF